MPVSESVQKERSEEGIRLNRYLAMCGLGSRREVESLITSGRISVDGDIVRELSTRVSNANEVLCDGRKVFPVSNIYLVMNKPLGVVCAVRDKYYDTVIDILPEIFQKGHIFPVGRLDRMTTGLLILTNDGDLAQKIIHPRAGIEKMYEVMLDKKLTPDDLEKWRKGLFIEGKFLKPVSVSFMQKFPNSRWIRVTLAEGVKREVRIMAQSLSYNVIRLSRKRIGRMGLNDLPCGEIIQVTKEKLWEMIHQGGTI